MSANPDAFEFLRRAAYEYVRKHGKDQGELLDFCSASIAEWVKESGSALSDAEAERLAADVAKWVFNTYNSPRKKAARSREVRAATEVTAPLLLEFAAEQFGSATIRNAARVGGQSKSTVGRHLRYHGVSPRRQAKIKRLPPLERRLVSLLDATFPRDGGGLVLMDDLAVALWDGKAVPPLGALPDVSRSTKSARRKKLAQCLLAIKGHGLGFDIILMKSSVAVRRGRKFGEMKETAVWIENQRQHGFRAIALPEPSEGPTTGYWADQWLECVLSVLELGLIKHIADARRLEPFVRLTNTLIDTRPLYDWFWRAINSYSSDPFDSNLANLAQKIYDPHLREAVRNIAFKIGRIQMWGQYDSPVQYFDDVNREIGFMVRLRDISPDSYARCGYLRDVIFDNYIKGEADEGYTIAGAIAHCRKLRELEASGEWLPPSASELAHYHPNSEPPF